MQIFATVYVVFFNDLPQSLIFRRLSHAFHMDRIHCRRRRPRAPQLPAQEAVAKSKIVSVGLFKNGLAVVKREVLIDKAGTYRLDASPEPVHGSFWIEANSKVEAAVRMRATSRCRCTPKAG